MKFVHACLAAAACRHVNPCGGVFQLHASMKGGYHTQHCRLHIEHVHCYAILLLQLKR